MTYLKNIITNFLLFAIVILVYSIGMPLLFSGFDINYLFEILNNLYQSFLTLEILKDKFFLGVLIFLVGIPAIIINYFAKKITRNINFILLPIFATILVIFFSFVHAIFFEDDSSDMKGLALTVYMIGAIIFQIIFSIIFSIFRIFKLRNYKK